jgi:hypothetical protein
VQQRQRTALFAYVQAEANFEFEGLAWGRERQGHVRACDVQAEMNSMWRDARCVPPDTPRLFALLPQIVLANLVSGDAAYRGNLGGHGTQYMHDSVVSTPCDDELAACADEDDAASASSSSPASNSRHRTLSIAPATLAANDCILICEALRKFESGARVCLPPSTRPSTAPRRRHLDQTARMCFDVGCCWNGSGQTFVRVGERANATHVRPRQCLTCAWPQLWVPLVSTFEPLVATFRR